MNSDRSHTGPIRQRHNPIGRSPRSAQRSSDNNSDRSISADECIRTLERHNKELIAELSDKTNELSDLKRTHVRQIKEFSDRDMSLRNLNFNLQLTIEEIRKGFQSFPAAQIERSGPRQNEPIRHETYPQVNTGKAVRGGPSSSAIDMTVPSTITFPKQNMRKSSSAPVSKTFRKSPTPAVPARSPVVKTFRESPASAVPAKSPDHRFSEAEIYALIALAETLRF